MIGDRQFFRHITVEVLDFDSKIKTTFGNDFEIEFEYFKTIDHSSDDDRGSIKIYGLTEETIKSIQVNSAEVKFYCGYEESEVSLLFIASIMRVYSEVVSNITVTTIDCNANLLDYFTLASVNPESKGVVSLGQYLNILAKQMGSDDVQLHLPNLNKEDDAAFLEFFKTSATQAVLFASTKDIISILANNFGLLITKERTKSGAPFIWIKLSDLGVELIYRSIKQGYPKVKTSSEIEDNKIQYFRTLQADTESEETYLITRKTGLLSFKKEYKFAQKEAVQKEVLFPKSGEAWFAPREYDRTFVLKYKKDFWRVKALINPKIKPQSLVRVVNETVPLQEFRDRVKDNPFFSEDILQRGFLGSFGDTFRGDMDMTVLVRVRDILYKGNNKRGEWSMELYCETGLSDTGIDEDLAKFIEKTNAENQVVYFEDEETLEAKEKEKEDEKERKAQAKKDKAAGN